VFFLFIYLWGGDVSEKKKETKNIRISL